MIETIIVVPVLLFVGMAILHFALLAQAKANLDYATLMAARIGSSKPNFGFGTNQNLMETEIRNRMGASELVPGRLPPIRICILRPNQKAFDDHGVKDPSGNIYIPNDNLPFRSTAIKANSGMSVQDANILHLQVAYRFDTPIPFMNFYDDGPGVTTTAPYEKGAETWLRGLYIRSETAVVMQTRAQLNTATKPHVLGATGFVPCD